MKPIYLITTLTNTGFLKSWAGESPPSSGPALSSTTEVPWKKEHYISADRKIYSQRHFARPPMGSIRSQNTCLAEHQASLALKYIKKNWENREANSKDVTGCVLMTHPKIS